MTPESGNLPQQPEATPQPPAPVTKRRSTVLIVVITIVAAVIVLCLLCGLGLYAVRDASHQAETRAQATASAAAAVARQDLLDAAQELWFSTAVRYRGTVTTPTGDVLAVDAGITNEGSVLASIDGGKVQLLVTSAQTFVRSDQAFWRTHGIPDASVADYAKQWVKVQGTIFGIDFRQILAPALLAERLAPDTFVETDTTVPSRVDATGGDTIDGKPVQVLRANGLTVYLSTTEPKRIVRITSGTLANSTSRAAPRPMALAGMPALSVPARTNTAAASGFQLDLSDMTEPEVDELAKRLQQKLTELRSSVDSTVRFSIDGNVVLAPCTTSFCTATLQMHNSVSFNSPYLIANQPVYASITIDMTLDGRPIKSCPASRTMKPNANASVKCTATYNIPPSRNPTTHFVRASARATARGAVEADIAKMANDLKSEIKQSRAAREESGRSPTSTPAPATTGRPVPPCNEPNPGFADGGPGAWKQMNRSASSTALWPTYQEQVTGVKRTREYFYQGVDFDGYVNEGGDHIFLEAKGRGRAKSLLEAETRTAELDARAKQLRSQLDAISKTPGAKLRFVAAEQDYLDGVRSYMKNKLPANLYDKIEWKNDPHDFSFKGCK